MYLDSTSTHLQPLRELRRLEAGCQDLDQTLDKVVVSIANQMETDVASFYLLEPTKNSVVLMATVGLLQSCVGKLRMRFHEGLVGLVAQQCLPVALARAPEHPRFKYFPKADEDEYQSFLGVPILYENELQGVLVVQTIEPREFSRAEIDQLTGIADRLASSLDEHYF